MPGTRSLDGSTRDVNALSLAPEIFIPRSLFWYQNSLLRVAWSRKRPFVDIKSPIAAFDSSGVPGQSIAELSKWCFDIFDSSDASA